MLNRFQFIGRLGKEPEIRNLDNGSTVANFGVAITEGYKDKTTGEKKEITQWVNCVAWKGLANIAQKYLHKGDQIYAEGKLRTRSWEKDGITKYITEITLDNFKLFSGTSNHSATSQDTTVPLSATDDLPF